MAFSLKDLDAIIGYDGNTHSIAGLPTLGPKATTADLPSTQAIQADILRNRGTNAPASAESPLQIPSAGPSAALPTNRIAGNDPNSIEKLLSRSQEKGGVGQKVYKADIPSVSAAPGTAAYGEQRQALADYQKMHPWGSPVSEHPGTWGKIAHGLATVGNIAGNVVAPGVMANIPGTELNKERETARNANWIKLGGEEEQKQAQTGLEKAETWKAMHPGEEKTAELSAEQRFKQGAAESLGLKPGTPEYNAYMGVPQTVGKTPDERAYDALIAQGVPPEKALQQVKGAAAGKTPQEQAYSSFIAQGMSPEQALAAVTKTPPTNEAQEDQRYEKIRADQGQGKPVSADDLAWAKAYEGRKALGPQATVAANAPTKNQERSDKSYQFNSTALEKEAQPIEQLNQRMSKLNDALAQGNMQADALVAPELLSVMAGGAGTGLRMNEAEIARVVGGRTVWENLKASLQKWSTDPNTARSITPDQDKQIRALVKTVQDRLTQKMSVIDQSRQSLLEADDPKEHRKIVTDAKRQIDAIDSSKGAGDTVTMYRGGKEYNIPKDQATDFEKAGGSRTK